MAIKALRLKVQNFGRPCCWLFLWKFPRVSIPLLGQHLSGKRTEALYFRNEFCNSTCNFH